MQRGSPVQFNALSGILSMSSSESQTNPFPARPGLHCKTNFGSMEAKKDR